MDRKYALLMDAGFLKYRLGSAKNPMDAAAVEAFVAKAQKLNALSGLILHRIYFYDSKPLETTVENPFDGSTIDFGATAAASRNKSMHSALSKAPFFSMRYGELNHSGWELKKRAVQKAVAAKKKTFDASDLQPGIRQKGVDMRIGLDIAHLTLKKHVDVIVLVTADSDFIPAMKFARREGAQLFLLTLGAGVREGMREHADLVIEDRMQ